MEILSFLTHFWVCQITSFGTPISAPYVVNWMPHMFMLDILSSLALRCESQGPPSISLVMGSALAARVAHGIYPTFVYFYHFCTQIGVSPFLETA